MDDRDNFWGSETSPSNVLKMKDTVMGSYLRGVHSARKARKSILRAVRFSQFFFVISFLPNFIRVRHEKLSLVALVMVVGAGFFLVHVLIDLLKRSWSREDAADLQLVRFVTFLERQDLIESIKEED